MPRRIIRDEKKHDRNVSLGWIGVWWIENFVVHGRGGVQGTPIRYGDEFTGFIVDCYALDAFGKRLYNSAFLSRPKGTDKSGLAAALVLLETFGPARYAGIAKGGETYTFLGKTYTYTKGEVMGKPVTNPMVKIMATEEGQTGNVYDNIYYNLNAEGTPLYALKLAYGVEVGKTQITLATGGWIRPTSAGAASKDGGLETFAVFDETHLYTTPTLRAMYKTVVRNLAKRRKEGTWFIETTTMYEPGANSIAEDTYAMADLAQDAKLRRNKLLFDHQWAQIESLDKSLVQDENNPRRKRVETDDEYETRLKSGFIESYGDAIAWNDLDGLLDDLFDPRSDEEDTIRYFFNAVVEGNNAWLKVAAWDKIGVKKRREVAKAAGEKYFVRPPMKGDVIALGFDGGLSDDATVLIGCRIEDNYVFKIGVWEAPDTKAAKHWRIDKMEVNAVLDAAMKKFKVVAFLADPPHWQDEVEAWETKYGPHMAVRVSQTRPISFPTNNHVAMAKVVERAETSIKTGTVIHGDDPTLTRHVRNAHRWRRNTGDVIGKDRRGGTKKMDAAVGMCLAIEGAALYRKAKKKTKSAVPSRVR